MLNREPVNPELVEAQRIAVSQAKGIIEESKRSRHLSRFLKPERIITILTSGDAEARLMVAGGTLGLTGATLGRLITTPLAEFLLTGAGAGTFLATVILVGMGSLAGSTINYLRNNPD